MSKLIREVVHRGITIQICEDLYSGFPYVYISSQEFDKYLFKRWFWRTYNMNSDDLINKSEEDIKALIDEFVALEMAESGIR